MDRRSNRVQPIRLSPKFFTLDIHKSMFINDLMITIPKYYTQSWGEEVLFKHNKENYKWDTELIYISPKDCGGKTFKFNVKLTLSFSKNRSQASNYRLKWDKQFAVQLAKDYPKSFVRSLEFHIGDEFYKKQKLTEYDIGGFKEQLQVKINWKDGKPFVTAKEFFRVKERSQVFPNVFKELSSYLIADYLLSDKDEILRRIQVGDWRLRKDLVKELNENNIYLLLNRDKKELYIGETKKSLGKRYPLTQKHHSFDDWTEYTLIQLPPETSDHTRLLIERVLIAMAAKLFPNQLNSGKAIALNDNNGLKLVNKKR